MHARALLAHGWLAGVLALASGLAHAATCPVYPDDTLDIAPNWPMDKSPTGQISISGSGTGNCPGQSGTYTSGTQASYGMPYTPTSIADGIAHMEAAMQASYSGTQTFVHCQGVNTQSGYYWYRTSANSPRRAGEVRVYFNSEACDPPEGPPECGEPGHGERVEGRAATFEQFRSESITNCLDGCSVAAVRSEGPGIDKVGGLFYFSAWVEYDGTSCTSTDTIPPEDAADDPAEKPAGEVCRTSANGVEYCNSDLYGENCGYVNDKFVCLGKTDPDECWVNEDGSRLCGESAPMPPVPDNGTAGIPATPTDTVQAAEGQKAGDTYNYYNSGVVAGSSRPAGDSGANPNRPGSTDPATGGGDGEGEESAGTASGGVSCTEPPVCEGNPIQCAILAQQWRARCVDEPSEETLLSTLGATENEDGSIFGSATYEAPASFNAVGWLGSAECLADYSLVLGGQLPTVEIPFSEWCWLLQVIGVFVMIAAYMSAARIVMGGI